MYQTLQDIGYVTMDDIHLLRMFGHQWVKTHIMVTIELGFFVLSMCGGFYTLLVYDVGSAGRTKVPKFWLAGWHLTGHDDAQDFYQQCWKLGVPWVWNLMYT